MNMRVLSCYGLGVFLAIATIGCSKKEEPKPTESNEAAPAAEEPTASAKPEAAAPKAITQAPYGESPDGKADIYTLTNKNGLYLKVTNYGVIITEFFVPDRDGKLGDIVGGYENLDGYVKKTPYFGTTVGRIANRIQDAKFALEGKTYELAKNNGPHSLHGGTKGWDKVLWKAEPEETPDGPSIHFTYVSKDGEEGFPGTVTAKVSYTLNNKNEFLVDMEATTDKTTIVNMAHHSYWNLGGYKSGTILDHELMIAADKYTPGKVFAPDTDPVPYGVEAPVKGTPFDFTTPKLIGKDIEAVGGKPVGYDNNWIVNGNPNEMRLVAKVKHPKTGRVMVLEADKPGVQFYAGIFLDGTITGKGMTYPQYGALCLETQAFPNAIDVPAWKDQVILKPGDKYTHHMIHRFSTE